MKAMCKKIFISVILILSQFIMSAQVDLDKTIKTVTIQRDEVRSYVPQNIVIAHRGTTYWAPEETEAAYRWARNIGADYLEADLQLSKDGIILTLHDNNLTRTTDIQTIYPSRMKDPINTFTYQELLKLDAGSWFNQANPSRAREKFKGLEILTLQDVIKIAEGYKIKRDENNRRVIREDGTFVYVKDEKDNGHRPGIYIELKEPELNQGIEEKLEQELTKLNWNILKKPENTQHFYINGKVNIGHTNGKVILQTFSEESLINIQKIFQNKIPTTLLIEWHDGQFENNQPSHSLQNKVAFANRYQATFLGPSIRTKNQYFSDWIHAQKLGMHSYSFDTLKQMQQWKNLVDGMFTNRADLSIEFYIKNKLRSQKLLTTTNSKKLLDDLGY
ncbi:MAG: glycerophosphodiester phosphodiesterase [Neisseriaceae bacterium]|nr:MAG: glycerophosphodiester phosphodiesterase [Neisseriaceae bacterium]